MSGTYQTQSQDTWDVISKKLYGSELYMDRLIAANLDHRKVVFFSDGVTLNVPDIASASGAFEKNLPPWKRGSQNG